MNEYNITERKGVNEVERIFLEEFNWIFREQAISDMGIDAHIEIVHNGKPTGKLISLQIKTGESHFVNDDNKLTYYGKNRHLEYWTNHSLPVLLIAHLPNSKETYWALVSPKNITQTPKAWKIEIPKSQLLNADFKLDLIKLGEGTDESIKNRKLVLDKPLMEVLRNGGKVCVVFIEWLHKTLNRTPIKIIVIEDGIESVAKEWGIFYAGYENEEIMKLIFPWAKASIDKEYYEEHLNEKTLKNMYNLEWLYQQEFYPFRVNMNEVADFRLELSLNELGKSFLTYMDYLENGNVF